MEISTEREKVLLIIGKILEGAYFKKDATNDADEALMTVHDIIDSVCWPREAGELKEKFRKRYESDSSFPLEGKGNYQSMYSMLEFLVMWFLQMSYSAEKQGG
jgi:hypothetical protein